MTDIAVKIAFYVVLLMAGIASGFAINDGLKASKYKHFEDGSDYKISALLLVILSVLMLMVALLIKNLQNGCL